IAVKSKKSNRNNQFFQKEPVQNTKPQEKKTIQPQTITPNNKQKKTDAECLIYINTLMQQFKPDNLKKLFNNSMLNKLLFDIKDTDGSCFFQKIILRGNLFIKFNDFIHVNKHLVAKISSEKLWHMFNEHLDLYRPL